jgi:hypothetical protein
MHNKGNMPQALANAAVKAHIALVDTRTDDWPRLSAFAVASDILK